MVVLVMAGVGCAREAKSPDAAPRESASAAAPASGASSAASSPSQEPAIASNEVAGLAPSNAELPPAPGPANVVKDEDEIAKIGPNLTELEQEARDNAQAEAREKAKWAKLAREADRRGTEDWSRDRVQKASARVAQLQNQSSRVPPAKRGRFNTDMMAFHSHKAEVLSRINSLSATGSEEWKLAKQELDRAIDEMDQALIRLEGDF